MSYSKEAPCVANAPFRPTARSDIRLTKFALPLTQRLSHMTRVPLSRSTSHVRSRTGGQWWIVLRNPAVSEPACITRTLSSVTQPIEVVADNRCIWTWRTIINPFDTSSSMLRCTLDSPTSRCSRSEPSCKGGCRRWNRHPKYAWFGWVSRASVRNVGIYR